MRHAARRLTTVAVLALSSACGAFAGAPGSEARSPHASAALQANRVGNALVLSGEQIDGQSSDVLGLIARGVSGLQIRRGASCPEIRMRGQKSVSGHQEPFVFVNGTQAGNTCVLEMMRSEDVARVEVYPMGVASRPGYPVNPNGLILVFLKNAL